MVTKGEAKLSKLVLSVKDCAIRLTKKKEKTKGETIGSTLQGLRRDNEAGFTPDGSREPVVSCTVSFRLLDELCCHFIYCATAAFYPVRCKLF